MHFYIYYTLCTINKIYKTVSFEIECYIINNVKGGEEIAFHYSTSDELKGLYLNFSQLLVKPVDYKFIDGKGNTVTIKAFVVIAIK